MTDVEKMLCDLASAGRMERAPAIDVKGRVCATLAESPRLLPLEKTPFVLAGMSIAAAVAAFIVLVPEWRSTFEPWAVYLQL